MRILAVGDIVGKTGIQKLKEVLPNVIKENNIDFVIVNGENAADKAFVFSGFPILFLSFRCPVCTAEKVGIFTCFEGLVCRVFSTKNACFFC